MKITTNNVPRFTIGWYELSDSERAEFDWCNEDDTFVRYRGALFCLCNFMRTSDFDGWDGIYNDTAFSGVLIRLCGDGDRVIVGRVYG